mgnify:CR=1 FL=1
MTQENKKQEWKGDLSQFQHGEEGTHSCCNYRLKKEGGKARCCVCVPHNDCEYNKPEKIISKLISKLWNAKNFGILQMVGHFA